MTTTTKTSSFTSAEQQKETPQDKTARIVKRITEDEAEMRHLKTARLRKARFESEEVSVAETAPTTSSKSSKRP